MKRKINFGNGLALLPLIIFISIFLSAGLITDDFYSLPAPIAVLCGIIAAFILFSYNISISDNIKVFIKGCGNNNILTMCLITLLAGAFAVMTKEIGAVNAIVHIAQKYLSIQFLYAGVFILASFLSFSSGTSTGTITALAPVASGFVIFPEINASLIAASLLGGAMFGDNLSFISDTTIAATQTQGCHMKDKFRINVRIALPASLLTIGVLTFIGISLHQSTNSFSAENISIEWIKIVPYLLVIILASTGTNVFVTLFLGILASGAIAFWENTMNLLSFSQNIYAGFTQMNEIFLVFLLMGGLTYMIEKEGGIQFLMDSMSRFMTSKLRAKTGIAFLVGTIDFAIANNTIAIITSAPIAREISNKFGISPAYTASILDISSCIVQGFVPFGAQMLLLLKLIQTDITYLDIVAQSYYIWILLVTTILYFSFISSKIKKKELFVS